VDLKKRFVLILRKSIVFSVYFRLIFKDTHIISDNYGRIVGIYRKTHLFDTALGGNNTLKESEIIEKGDKICRPIDTPIGKIGLSIVF